MYNAFYGYLGLPIGVRFTIILGIVLVLYLIFGHLLYNLLALAIFLLKKLAYRIYLVIEIPASALHKLAGGVFASIAQGITAGFSKVCAGLEKCYNALHKPKTIHPGKAILVFIVCGAYFIIPGMAGLHASIFSFWENTYLKQETRVATLIESASWFPAEPDLQTEIAPSFETMQYGDRNERISELQEKLKELGYYKDAIDGSYGRKTERAVKAFQKDMQLETNGICDEKTWSMLFTDADVELL